MRSCHAWGKSDFPIMDMASESCRWMASGDRSIRSTISRLITARSFGLMRSGSPSSCSRTGNNWYQQKYQHFCAVTAFINQTWCVIFPVASYCNMKTELLKEVTVLLASTRRWLISRDSVKLCKTSFTDHLPPSFDQVFEVDGSGQFNSRRSLWVISGGEGKQEHRIVGIPFKLLQKLLRYRKKISVRSM